MHCAVCSCALPSPRGPLYLNAETTKKEQNTYKKILALYTQTQYYKNRPVLYIYLSFALPTLLPARRKSGGLKKECHHYSQIIPFPAFGPPTRCKAGNYPPPLTGTLPRDDRHFVHCVKYKCDFMVVFNLSFSSSNFMFSQFF